MNELIWINDISIKHLVFRRADDGLIRTFYNSASSIKITKIEDVIKFCNALSSKDSGFEIVKTGNWINK